MATATQKQSWAAEAKVLGISPIRPNLDESLYGTPLFVIPPLEGGLNRGVKVSSVRILDDIRRDLGAIVTTKVLYLGTFPRGEFSMEYLFPFDTNGREVFSEPVGRALEIVRGHGEERTRLALIQFSWITPKRLGDSMPSPTLSPEKIAERAAKLIYEVAIS
jgi:hypothetical protein